MALKSLIFASLYIDCALAGIGEVVVNYNTGYVDGVPPPGNLASVQFTTPVAKTIAEILQLNVTAQGSPTRTIEPEKEQGACMEWGLISITLTRAFRNITTGECTESARAAIRAGFHDAGSWSGKLAAQGQDYGGADGSLYLYGESTRSENNGLQEITATLGALAQKHHVGVADMLQFAAAHATVTCPLGPRMRTFIGRNDGTKPAPDGLLPSALASAEVNIALFADKRIGPLDLVALLGAHSVSRQSFFNTTVAGQSQDSTPGVWDTNFYEDTIRSEFNSGAGITTFPSDKAISLYGPLQEEWNGYVRRQSDWNEHFSRAYLRLSITGVNNIQDMVECTDALPLPVTNL